jgi:hypothetical protein
MNPVYNRENKNNHLNPISSNQFTSGGVNNFGSSTRVVNNSSTYSTVGGSHTEYVNNKEMFNQRIFERNNQMVNMNTTQNMSPSYFNENYYDNRKDIKQFDSRIFDLIPIQQKNNIMGVNDFRDDNQNNFKNTNVQGFTNQSFFNGNYSEYFNK